jgi:hypothetical protein
MSQRGETEKGDLTQVSPEVSLINILLSVFRFAAPKEKKKKKKKKKKQKTAFQSAILSRNFDVKRPRVLKSLEGGKRRGRGDSYARSIAVNRCHEMLNIT